MHSLKQIVYISATTLTKQELLALMEQSVKSNEHHEITGLMLYKPDSIMQVIEGGETDVDQLYRNISHDSRHSAVTELLNQPVRKREFPDWSMSFRDLNIESNKAGMSDFLAHKVNQNWAQMPSSDAMVLLRSFRD